MVAGGRSSESGEFFGRAEEKRFRQSKRSSDTPFDDRLRGRCRVAGALAADIIGSVVLPMWEAIGQLAAIALIPTFLNFFVLERDLEAVASEAH